jgi:carboxymethylenebutenolidase
MHDSRKVEIPVGDLAMKSYFAAPEGGRHPAVILLQEIFGVNAEMRRITALLAEAGYAALAINYYHRSDPDLDLPYNDEGMELGMAAASKTSRATYRADIMAAIAWLNARPEVARGRIATWGFCMGGAVAFYSATLPGITAAVAFYGGSIASPFASGEPEALSDVAAVRAPLFLVYGGRDQHITPAQVARTEEALKAAGKAYELRVYPDQDHGFFRRSSTTFSTPAVADAWSRVQAFLAKV